MKSWYSTAWNGLSKYNDHFWRILNYLDLESMIIDEIYPHP